MTRETLIRQMRREAQVYLDVANDEAGDVTGRLRANSLGNRLHDLAGDLETDVRQASGATAGVPG